MYVFKYLGILKIGRSAFFLTSPTLSIPKNPKQAVELQTGTDTLSGKMPHANTLENANEVNNTVVYSPKNESTVDYAV